MPLRAGNRVSSTKPSSLSPVMPSGSAAQALQRRSPALCFSPLSTQDTLTSGDAKSSSRSASSCSRSSQIFRNSSQTSWPIRWASPSTPTSLRMMSWMDLMVVDMDMERVSPSFVTAWQSGQPPGTGPCAQSVARRRFSLPGHSRMRRSEVTRRWPANAVATIRRSAGSAWKSTSSTARMPISPSTGISTTP